MRFRLIQFQTLRSAEHRIRSDHVGHPMTRSYFGGNVFQVKNYDDEVAALMRQMDDHQNYIDGKARYYQGCTN